MKWPETVVLQVDCVDESCGMLSVYKFWTADGSHAKMMDCCGHAKNIPLRRQEVLERAGLIEVPEKQKK